MLQIKSFRTRRDAIRRDAINGVGTISTSIACRGNSFLLTNHIINRTMRKSSSDERNVALSVNIATAARHFDRNVPYRNATRRT